MMQYHVVYMLRGNSIVLYVVLLTAKEPVVAFLSTCNLMTAACVAGQFLCWMQTHLTICTPPGSLQALTLLLLQSLLHLAMFVSLPVLLPAVQQLEIEVHKLAGSDEHPLWRL
jgi:hypothetical protein